MNKDLNEIEKGTDSIEDVRTLKLVSFFLENFQASLIFVGKGSSLPLEWRTGQYPTEIV